MLTAAVVMESLTDAVQHMTPTEVSWGQQDWGQPLEGVQSCVETKCKLSERKLSISCMHNHHTNCFSLSLMFALRRIHVEFFYTGFFKMVYQIHTGFWNDCSQIIFHNAYEMYKFVYMPMTYMVYIAPKRECRRNVRVECRQCLHTYTETKLNTQKLYESISAMLAVVRVCLKAIQFINSLH